MERSDSEAQAEQGTPEAQVACGSSTLALCPLRSESSLHDLSGVFLQGQEPQSIKLHNLERQARAFHFSIKSDGERAVGAWSRGHRSPAMLQAGRSLPEPLGSTGPKLCSAPKVQLLKACVAPTQGHSACRGPDTRRDTSVLQERRSQLTEGR